MAHRHSSTASASALACFALAGSLFCGATATRASSDAQRCPGRTPTTSDPCSNFTNDCLPNKACEKDQSGGLCKCVPNVG